MLETLNQKRQEFIEEAIKQLSFYDWSDELCAKTNESLGFPKNQHALIFPHGLADIVDYYEKYMDQKMLSLLDYTDSDNIKRIQDKIKFAVRCRLDNKIPNNKLAISKTQRYYKKLANVKSGLKASWRTVDLMWQFAGDKSTDYNYYTKRSLLFGVYKSTSAFYIKDDSSDNSSTWDFLDNKIQQVLKIGSIKKNLTISNMFAKLPFIRLYKNKK